MQQLHKRAGVMAEETLNLRNQIEMEKRMQDQIEKEDYRQYYEEM